MDSHPSQVVENILQSIKPTRHKDSNTTADVKLPGKSSVPSRFRLVSPKKAGFHDVVQQVTQETNPHKGFKQAVKTVINATKNGKVYENKGEEQTEEQI